MDTTENSDQEYLTPGEVARLLCVTPRTVSRWADQGHISHIVTYGRHRRFLRADVERLLELARRSERAPSPT